MAQKFWVNNYFIDVSRNQIQHQQQATQLPPKALKVLEVLASRAGDVVTHEELMDIVWGKSIVGPNTLQRAIAQLRKAFGDDSKQQAFIKTHAKQGYSLDAHVRWEDNAPAQVQDQEQAPPKTNKGKRFGFYLLLFVPIFFATVIAIKSTPTRFDRLTPITASDEQEFNASYSPDGKYLVFNRFVGQCLSHLWAKDLSNNQEVRLSRAPGHYNGLSWSADGSQIALVLQSSCESLSEQPQQCWQLQTLDFASAWRGEPNNALRYDCEQTEISHPSWLNDGRIALLRHSNGPNSTPNLIIHDARTNDVVELELPIRGRLYSLDYSRATNQFATTSIADDNQHLLSRISINGELVSEAQIKRLPHHSVYDDFPIRFAPDGKRFLTEVAGQLYFLTKNGSLTLSHTDSFNGLSAPIFHPTDNKIAATQGTKDFDIGYVNLSGTTGDADVFARSTEVDANAQFQPNGTHIAFVSYRSGNSQLWLKDNNNVYQLTHFENGMRGILFSWSPQGNRLVTNVNHHITLVELDGSTSQIDTPVAVNILMPWTKTNTLLVTANINGADRLYKIDITSGETTDTGLSNVMWAAYTSSGNILYSDNQKDFWLLKDSRSIPLNALHNKLYGKRALFKNDVLLGLDADNQLWQYDITTNILTEVAQLNKDVIFVSDIRADEMLATKFIGGRRELVELTVSDSQ